MCVWIPRFVLLNVRQILPKKKSKKNIIEEMNFHKV